MPAEDLLASLSSAPGDNGSGSVASTAAATLSAPEPSIIARLRGPPVAPREEWRRASLVARQGGNTDSKQDAIRILEACLQVRTEEPSEEFALTLQLLAAQRISNALDEGRRPDIALELLSRAEVELLEVDAINTDVGSPVLLEALIMKGFLAVARFLLDEKASDPLKRADLFFDTALKVDSTSPRALLGKAVVHSYHRNWGKALPFFRQVLARAAPSAPLSGVRHEALQKLRFALATCFCGLERFGQAKGALSSLVVADAKDVESLCALSRLEARAAIDGVGNSMEYLDEAVKQDGNNPVVLLQLATHAFYCGLEASEDLAARSSNAPAAFVQAEALLGRALAGAHSRQICAEVRYQMGRLRHAQGRFAEAYVEYNQCRSLEPDHCPCLYGFAQACVHMGKLVEGAAALEKVKELKGNVPDMLRLLCYIYLRIPGKAKEAAVMAQVLVNLDDTDAEAWGMKAEAEDQLLASKQQGPIALHKVGLEAYEKVASLLDDSEGNSGSPEIWNNLGTLRGLQGDTAGAKVAYARGMKLAESRLAEADLTTEETKDLQIARATMRFNRAWLAESSGDHPDHLQATQEYLAIREEHSWYTEALLGLGAQFQRMGDVGGALQNFTESMEQNPVLASLMAAEAYRQQGKHTKALKVAEMAVRRAGEKQFHYAVVYLGNLYYEVACSTRKGQKERESNMLKALTNFSKALKKDKDCPYAANGIGMVFAQRGKYDFARRTFQSVIQHQSMTSDPSVYVNLGHTYARSGADGLRKAIALYERARKLRSNDVSIYLYLAKAYFGMQDFEKARSILSNAIQIWPEDVLLRYNLAIVLENFGKALVSEQKTTKRTQGAWMVIKQIDKALDLLDSAIRLYGHVELRWAAMLTEDRRAVATASGAPANLVEEMNSVDMHKEYCTYLKAMAQEDISDLRRRQEEVETKMRKIAEDKAAKESHAKEVEEHAKMSEEHRRIEMEEEALKLMTGGMDIDLGKNLEQKKDAKAPVVKSAAKSKAKPSSMREHIQAPIDHNVGGEVGSSKPEAKEHGKKEKKEKKKKRKKDSKGKKDKKRRREEGSDEAGADADVEPGEVVLPTRDGEAEDRGAEGGVGESGGGADSGEDEVNLDGEEEGRHERKAKKEKKRKNKKSKKEKKSKRRRRDASESDNEEAHGGGEGGDAIEAELFGSPGGGDGGLEEELFGSPDKD